MKERPEKFGPERDSNSASQRSAKPTNFINLHLIAYIHYLQAYH